MSLEAAINTLVSRLETVTARLEAVEKQLQNAPAPAAAAAPGDTSASVSEYEALIAQFIQPYVELSAKIGDDVSEQAKLVLAAVNAQRDFLRIAAASKKPSDEVFQSLFKPIADIAQQIVALKESKRTSKNAHHLATVSEGIPALSWVGVSPTPGPFIAEMRGSSEFWSNRILKDYKGKDQLHVDWVSAFNSFLKELQNYVKKNHTTGVTWNPRGGDAKDAVSSAPSSAPAPPPPGPPPPLDDAPASDQGKKGADMNAVFSQLSQGEGVTKGLKKVTSDMKTKNRDPNEKSSIVPASSGPKSSSAPKAQSKAPSRPPKFGLEGNKWTVEFQQGNRELVIANPEPKHTVYIYKCNETTVQIKGKVNAITLDDCTKTAVVFENCIASFEIVNCKSVEVQVTGTVPSVAIDKTSGAQVYLSKTALNTEIITSKSSEMNVVLPGDDDLVEMPIPEQYKTRVVNGKLVTDTVTHA